MMMMMMMRTIMIMILTMMIIMATMMMMMMMMMTVILPTASPRDLVTLQWVRDSSSLPAGRYDDDGDGGLEIRNVQLQDSGVYVCVARLGARVTRANTTLYVQMDRTSSGMCTVLYCTVLYCTVPYCDIQF